MNTIERLTGPDAALFLPGVLAAVALALLGGVLGPLVVLRRMAFIGQGVSHAAFGAVGIATILGLSGLARWGVIVAFCIASALGIGWLRQRRLASGDTAIGIVLVGAMALGAILISAGRTGSFNFESLLFGSIYLVSWLEAGIAWGVLVLTLAILWRLRRPLVFWAFDEAAAATHGVPVRALERTLLVLLALAIVTAMKLAGVVLATALFVLPAATALRLTDRFLPAFGWSLATSLLGLLAGIVISFETDTWPPGASIVAALLALMAAGEIARRLVPARLTRRADAPS